MFFKTPADSRPPFEHDERRHGGERQVDRLRDLAFLHLEDVGCLCADIQLHAGLRQGVEQGEASHLTPGRVSCGNCHLNGGQRELALPLVGSAAMFPEYNRRAGRDFTLADRIVGCFMRSENATGGLLGGSSGDVGGVLPEPTSDEVLALVAYIEWLSDGFAVGENPPWRKRNRIPAERLISLDQLDPEVGAALFAEHCSTCHGEDGQGVQIGDKRAGPLWGPDSWNDGAGAARVYTLAGIIRYMMPNLDPGVLTDEEAQQVAAFITSQPRPVYPYKDQDYLTEPRPVDAVQYDR